MFRRPVTHVVLIDGTFASLMEGRHSSIGHIYRLLRRRRGADLRIHYAAGQEWEAWRSARDLAMGSRLVDHITDAYGWLASAYRPGDEVFLMGYSRGAFAVRSLAGLIGRVGLVLPEQATERNVRQGWRLYRQGTPDDVRVFHQTRCHAHVPIRMLGVFDTVMALGVRLPLLWMLTEPRFRFHDHQLGGNLIQGVQALALDETRAAFQPILWNSAGHAGRVRQMWFRGCHADIGGQLAGDDRARPLANIPLRWMLEQAEGAGLPLPDNWSGDLVCDPGAPSVGSWRGWGKAFLARAPRVAGRDISEDLHPSVAVPYDGPAILSGHLADLARDPVPMRRRFRQAPRAIAHGIAVRRDR